jgi:hypothetical protein
MFKQLRGRPSHATVVAYVALFAALATGGAYAAGQITSGDIKKNAVKSKHIASTQVKPSDVAQGAGLEAVALVENDGPEFESAVPERGFESVDRNSTGVYCLVPSGDLDPAADPAIVTVEYNFSSGENYTATWDSGTGNCDDGEYEIQTYDATDSSATDDAAFVVMVP